MIYLVAQIPGAGTYLADRSHPPRLCPRISTGHDGNGESQACGSLCMACQRRASQLCARLEEADTLTRRSPKQLSLVSKNLLSLYGVVKI